MWQREDLLNPLDLHKLSKSSKGGLPQNILRSRSSTVESVELGREGTTWVVELDWRHPSICLWERTCSWMKQVHLSCMQVLISTTALSCVLLWKWWADHRHNFFVPPPENCPVEDHSIFWIPTQWFQGSMLICRGVLLGSSWSIHELCRPGYDQKIESLTHRVATEDWIGSEEVRWPTVGKAVIMTYL